MLCLAAPTLDGRKAWLPLARVVGVTTPGDSPRSCGLANAHYFEHDLLAEMTTLDDAVRIRRRGEREHRLTT
jgi:hypothetical protein